MKTKNKKTLEEKHYLIKEMNVEEWFDYSNEVEREIERQIRERFNKKWNEKEERCIKQTITQ
jgi:hypothetical protein